MAQTKSDYSKKNQWPKKEVVYSLRNSLYVSNESVPLPPIDYVADFVKADEELEILRQIETRDYIKEGFDQQRRVQRYRLPEKNGDGGDGNVPKSLLLLRARVEKATGCRAQFVAIEEYPTSKSSGRSSNQMVTTFESTVVQSCPEHQKLLECQNNDNGSKDSKHVCNCFFVAQIPLGNGVVQHLNKPVKRQANCWNLESPNHWTDIRMDQRSMLVKKGACLWDWRMRLEAASGREATCVVKFYSLPDPAAMKSTKPSFKEDGRDGDFGYIPHDEEIRQTPMPPMEDLLTIIITTSPIKSNPSTEMIEKTMETFIEAGPTFAYRCRKVIVCDGFRVQDISNSNNDNDNKEESTKVTRKHSNTKQKMRNGIVTSEQAENYNQYKANLRELCATASDDSIFCNATVEELDTRQGYGFALRHALRHCTSTQFVCVIQHDRTFMRRTPVEETLRSMWHHPNIKYVGMSMRSNLVYRDLFLGKYGRSHFDELNELILRVPELRVPASDYGPDSASTKSMVFRTDALRRNILSLAKTYRGSSQYIDEQKWNQLHPVATGMHQLTLTPTLFWYDNTHICETAHYRDFVFHPSYKMVAKGGFVEETISPAIKRTVDRLGLKEGHSRFGCYLLDDHSGMFFTGHLDGGCYMTLSERRQQSFSRASKSTKDTTHGEAS